MATIEELARANTLRTAPVDTTLTDRVAANNARARAALTGPVDTTLAERAAANQPRIAAPTASPAAPTTPPQVINNPVNPNVQRGVPSIQAQEFNASRAPVAPSAAPEAGAIRRVASQAGGILRGIPSAVGKAALPVAAGIEAVGIANTPTEQYAQRLGATAGESLGQDLALRAAGGMADLGNTLTFGVADRVGNALAGNGFNRSPAPAGIAALAAPVSTAAAATPAAKPATIASVAQTAAGAPVRTARAAPANVSIAPPALGVAPAPGGASSNLQTQLDQSPIAFATFGGGGTQVVYKDGRKVDLPAGQALPDEVKQFNSLSAQVGAQSQEPVTILRGRMESENPKTGQVTPGGIDQTVALPSQGGNPMREVPQDIYSAGQGAIARFQKAQADNAVNAADPVGAKTIQELAKQEAENAGRTKVAGIQAGASAYTADKSAEAATKNLMVVPGEEYLAPDGFTKLKKPSVLFDAASRQVVDLERPAAGNTLPKGMTKQIGTSGGKPVYVDANGKKFIGN